VYYRTLVMAEQGLDVDLLTFGVGQDVDVPGVRIHRVPRLRFLEPVPVGPSLAKLVLDVFMVVWTVALLVRHRHDLVDAHEEAAFWCVMLKPLFGFRLIYEMHSSLPQQLTNFGFTRSRVLIRLFEWLENRVLHTADAVISVCPALRDHALSIIPDPARHVLIENSIFEPVRLASNGRQASVAPNGRNATDLNLANAVSGGVRRNAVPDLDSGRFVVYAGTFEKYQGIDLLIRAFAYIAEAAPDVRMLLMGGAPNQVQLYRQMAQAEGVAERCTFTGIVERKVALELSAKADVLVSPRVCGTNTPLKIYSQLASGLPLVATRIESHTQILPEDAAFLAAPDPPSFGAAILAALTDQNTARQKAHAALCLYRAHYARPAYVAKLQRVLSIVGLEQQRPAVHPAIGESVRNQ
jgi:glycosyltransferase involved in cell wall biosynthesis